MTMTLAPALTGRETADCGRNPTRTMSIKLPSQTGSQSGNNSGSEANNDPKAEYEGHEETYMDYWQALSMVRYLGKACRTLGVAKKKDAGKSPWADHYGHFEEIKNALRDEVNGKGDFEDAGPLPGSLPGFKKAFETPDFDYIEVSKDNAEDFGLDPETFKDDEDPIYVTADYEAPDVVWYETDEDKDFSLREVLKIAEETDGIGEKTLKALKENLEAVL